ncbi:Hint domain-containing protein [Rhodosalinus sp. 5P4]|uniref:Hint domain-containing protein n=1 Tax=Rhodosalinus sp. 5P4 TaxID=3239196 RepID=UPI003523B7A8
MRSDLHGTFVISWAQTEVDGLDAAPVAALEVGAVWRWHGDPVCVESPDGLLPPGGDGCPEAARRRAARLVRGLVAAAIDGAPAGAARSGSLADQSFLPDQSFVVTDGARRFTVTLIEPGEGARPLLMFAGATPPRGTDLWVVDHCLARPAMPEGLMAGTNVICFTPGTVIATPDGPRRVETLHPGDRVQTKDDGGQEVLWVGSRRMSGARLFAMPDLRPVRIGPGALGEDRPDGALLVSPGHRVVLRGPVARALYDEPEVLVAARDLVGGRGVRVDLDVPEVTYIHLLLPRHEVLWANGVETESFHPAGASLETLDAGDRARLLAAMPEIAEDPALYGPHARRALSGPEARIMLREAA